MSDRIKFLLHQGKKVVFVDSSDLGPKEIVELLPKVTKIMIANQCHLLLQDVSNTRVDESVKTAALESVTTIARTTGREPCSAFIGMKGIQKIIANATVKGQFFAGTKQEAMDWLLKQA